MPISLTRTLYLLGLDGVLLATLMSHPIPFGVALFFLIAGVMLVLLVWVNALITTARRGRWDWFVPLVLFSGITLLI